MPDLRPAASTAVLLAALPLGNLLDCQPSVTPARAVVLAVDALSLGSQALCLAALATLGDLEYLGEVTMGLLSKTAAEPAPTHVVMKSVSGPGGRLIPKGVKVDATSWANGATLERLGYLSRLPGSSFNAHETKVAGHQLRERRRLFGAAFSRAQAELQHQAEVKRTNARSQAERTLAAALGKIGEWCAAEVELARKRLEAEILGGRCFVTVEQESAAGARRDLASYLGDAKEAEQRAADLRALAATAGPGPDAEGWSKRAAWFDQVAIAYRRQAAELEAYLKRLPEAPRIPDAPKVSC